MKTTVTELSARIAPGFANILMAKILLSLGTFSH
jgi:hypothetical protein